MSTAAEPLLDDDDLDETVDEIEESDDDEPEPFIESDDEEEGADDDDEPEPPKRASRRRRRNGTPDALRQMEEDEARDLRDYIREFAGGAAMRVQVYRKKPRTWNNRNVGGLLDTYDEPISLEDIQDAYGGGDYAIKVNRRNKQGRFVYAKQFTVSIAGDPKVPGDKEQAVQQQPDADVVKTALQMTAKSLEEANLRAERAAERAAQRVSDSGMDAELIDRIMSPLRDALEAQRRESEQLRTQLYDRMTAPPPKNEFQEKMMESLMGGQDARLNAIRLQHESEIRTLKENFRADLKDERRRFEDEIKRMESRHERELQMIQSHEQTTRTVSQSATDARVDALKMEITRLQTDLAESRKEVGELRARKDKGLLEQAKELDELKDALGVSGGDDDDKKWYERIADIAANSELVQRLVMPPEQQQQPMNPMAMMADAPENVPVQAPDGNIYVRRGAAVIPIDPAALRRQRAAKVRAGESGGDQGEEEVRQPSQSEVAAAVQFMEAAIKNGTPPEQFAASAISLVPKDVMAYLEKVGIDEFLSKVAQLTPDSPLRQQRGRNFARKVHQYLLTGTTEDVETPGQNALQ